VVESASPQVKHKKVVKVAKKIEKPAPVAKPVVVEAPETPPGPLPTAQTTPEPEAPATTKPTSEDESGMTAQPLNHMGHIMQMAPHEEEAPPRALPVTPADGETTTNTEATPAIPHDTTP
jgi:hypothetical protein